MSVQTSSGSKVYIGTTASNGATDSYTEVASITNVPQFGRVYSEIKFSSLGDRNVLKFKGQRDDGTIAIDLGRDMSDAGQAAAVVALDSDLDYNFKITLNDASGVSGSTPTTFRFKAKVMSYETIPGNATSVVMAKLSLGIKSGSIVEIAAS